MAEGEREPLCASQTAEILLLHAHVTAWDAAMPGNCTGISSAGAARAAQILKVVPYSAIQLCTYEAAKRGLRDREGHLSIPARLTAGALAGMTATLVRCSIVYYLPGA